MSEQPHELQERAQEAAHEAGHDPTLGPVSLTMAILAVLVAVVALLGHRAHTEELLYQTKASDQWAYFQSKNIRRHTYELFLDLVSISDLKNKEEAEKVKARYKSELERFKDDQKEISSEARHFEEESALERRRADRFDLGEVSLEVALVITSITLLTRRRVFWKVGLVLAAMGVAVAATGFWVH